MTHDHGKYLMHNAMRRALGQPPSAAGFEKLKPEVKQYLDGVLALLTTAPEDQTILQRVVSGTETGDRAALVATVSDKALRARLTRCCRRLSGPSRHTAGCRPWRRKSTRSAAS